MQKIAAGNWKMHGLQQDLAELHTIANSVTPEDPTVVLCPPAHLLITANEMRGPIKIGAQDCHTAKSGAHTGDISADQIAGTGAVYTIIGHSERRTDHAETDQIVHNKAMAAHHAHLTAIICIGETLAERDTDKTLEILETQLAGSVPDGATSDNTVIAYEPVWAIGTGLVPTLEQIAQAHHFIRMTLVERFGDDAQNFSLLYGGSVKGSNASDIFSVANVDGALVGGASLKAADFIPIIKALAQA